MIATSRKPLAVTLFLCLASLVLSACGVPPLLSPLPSLPSLFPKIDRHPTPWSYRPAALLVPPTYDPDSGAMWQIDLRARDLSQLDLRSSLADLMYADFDSQTTWPAANKIPKGFDWRRIMQIGKNPGLGIRSLHAKGITGRGVGIAIIDQTLFVDHQEYAGQLRFYEEASDLTGAWLMTSMHGAAVASIAVGKTVGVAPQADLYYIATSMCNQGTPESTDFACLAQSVRRILEINQQLPAGRKIRVLSISIGWTPQSKGFDEITAATQEAKAAGLLVICSSVELVHGFKFQALGRQPLADPDKADSYEPGLFWAKSFYEGRRFSDRLLVPMDSRTTASPGGIDEYVFYREGGWSWSIPYIAGVYALAGQVKPSITPDEFWSVAMTTGRTIQLQHAGTTIPFGPILDPQALIAALQAR